MRGAGQLCNGENPNGFYRPIIWDNRRGGSEWDCSGRQSATAHVRPRLLGDNLLSHMQQKVVIAFSQTPGCFPAVQLKAEELFNLRLWSVAMLARPMFREGASHRKSLRGLLI